MIKTIEQAERVQTRRFKAGKKGLSKAVRRWVKRETGMPSLFCGGASDIRARLPYDFSGCRSFEQAHPEIFKPKTKKPR